LPKGWLYPMLAAFRANVIWDMLEHVRKELAALAEARDSSIFGGSELTAFRPMMDRPFIGGRTLGATARVP
jgi:hypothetical protein